MTMHSISMTGVQLDRANTNAIVHAMRGVYVSASRVHAQLAEAGPVNDPDIGAVSPAVMKRAAKDALRLAGLRDILVVGHPGVSHMLDQLASDRHRVPGADSQIVDALAPLEGFAFDGKVVTIHGVPLPAGERQTSYFMAMRYWPLYAPGTLAHLVYCRDASVITPADHNALGVAEGETPDIIHLLGHDAAHVTDDMQELLLFYSTAMHRENLIALQRDHPALYVALWRRDMETAKKLARRVRNARLPASNPRSIVRSHAMRLLYGTSLMNEHERLFDIIEAVRAELGVTRQSLAGALRSSTSMTAVRAIDDVTHEFLAGSVVHVRSLHPSMNSGPAERRTRDPILERVRAAHENARAYQERAKRIRWIEDKMPALYFCGVEPAFLAPVALIQMTANMTRREDDFVMRGRKGQPADFKEARRSLTMRLGVIITAAICPATARSMLPREKVDEQLAAAGLSRTDKEWRDAVVPTLIANPRIAEQIERLNAKLHELGDGSPEAPAADEDRPHHSSPYDRAMKRTKAFFDMGKPGWTQGFFFDAWLRPDAEIKFLLNCTRFIRYSSAGARKRDAWDAVLGKERMPDGRPVKSTDIETGLPRQHPFKTIQDLFRGQFDGLQVPELVPDWATIAQRKWRDALVREVAPLLAAVSPITLDPQRAEWWWDDLNPVLKAIAAEGAWNS